MRKETQNIRTAKAVCPSAEDHRHSVSVKPLGFLANIHYMRIKTLPCLKCGKTVRLRKGTRILAESIGCIASFMVPAFLTVNIFVDFETQACRAITGACFLALYFLGAAARLMILKWGKWEEVGTEDVACPTKEQEPNGTTES